MKYLYTRKQILAFVMNPSNHYPYDGVIDMLKAKKGINAPEVRKNTEKMKKLDSERELVEIDKLNLDEYIENFDPLEIPSRTIGIEIMVEKKINEIIDHLNSIKKDRHSDIRKVNELSKKK